MDEKVVLKNGIRYEFDNDGEIITYEMHIVHFVEKKPI